MGCWITSSMSKVTKVSSSCFRIQTSPLSLLPINPTLPVIRNCRTKVWRQRQFSIGKTVMWKVRPKTEWTLTRFLRNFWYKQSPDTTFQLLRQIKMRACSLLTRVIFQALEGNKTRGVFTCSILASIVTILVSIAVILTSFDPILEKCGHLQVQYSRVLSQYL